MRNILIPTDFSKNAHEALFYTIKLFKNTPCKFYILHTFEVDTPVFTSRINKEKGKLLYEENLKVVEDKLDEILVNVSILSEGANHSFETLAITKPLVQTIHKTIEKKKIDLVVMGTKGASGLKQVFFGSNTVKVAKSLHETPLLIVPLEAAKFALNKIAFATAFKNDYTKQSLSVLKMFCELHNAELDVLHIDNLKPFTEEENKNRKVLEEVFEEAKYNTSLISKTKKNIERQIVEHAENFEFDMLAMIKYNHDDYYNWTNESVINNLGYHSKIPFLIIPEDTKSN